MTVTDDIHFERSGPLGVITLDRPKSLNALDRTMVEAMSAQLRDWREDRSVAAVLVRAVPGRAFCAGGDVRAVTDAAAKDGAASAMPFFDAEYRLNWRIKNLGKPYIALLDGVAMGGGVGISVHGTHRVVTENTLFAMPETGIGFFPDVGGTYFLPRCPGAIGMYLGLTGARLRAGDCLHAGIGTRHVPAARLPELVERLGKADTASFATSLEAALADLASAPAEPGSLEALRPAIDRHFAAADVGALVLSLESSDDAWAREQAAVLRRHSPLAVCLAFAQIRKGASLDFADCMRLEHVMVRHMLGHGEFAEGVRALLVDKDKQPRWRHQAIEAVTRAEVAAIMSAQPGDALPLDWQGT